MQPSLDPYARPLERRPWWALISLALTAALLVALVVGVERWGAQSDTLRRAASMMLAPYQELFLAGLPGEESAEYVVFTTSEAQDADWQRFFASQRRVRLARKGSVGGVLVVTLDGDRSEALDLLRGQPFVRLAVRNQGVFFCH